MAPRAFLMPDPSPHPRHPRPIGSPRCLAVVPVFNERGSVGKVISRLHRALPDVDVLVIDDGSTDDTLRQIPAGVAVVSLPFNLGIGGAMQTGYRYAALHGYDIAVQVDGDGQHRPSEVQRLIDHIAEGKSELVVGSRFLEPNPYTTYRQTYIRRTGAWMLRSAIKLLTGLTITDCTSGFRAANRRVIRAFAHWYPEDYPEPEVILLLHRAGYTISELHVKMRQRRSGQSSIGVLSGAFYVLKVTTCLILDTVRKPWPHEKIGGPQDIPAAAEAAAKGSSAAHPAAPPTKVTEPDATADQEPARGIYAAQEPHPAAAWRGSAAPGRPASPQV
jgi:glycosyltransferase involved in cell wall biosynthesis